VRHPRVLALDEPTEGLDASAEHELVETLEALHRADPELTLLAVTHQLELAARAATHLALFHAGAVVAGPRDRVLASATAGDTAGLAARLLQAARPRHAHGEAP